MSEHCQSFYPGHGTHWIPVLRVYAETPRQPIQITHLEGTAFEVTEANNQKHIWHHHQPKRLKSFVAKHPDAFNRVAGTTYVTCKLDGHSYWFNMSATELQECPAQKAEEMIDIYLASDILVGFDDGSTWLFTDNKPGQEETPPNTTTYVISACNPRSLMKDPIENLEPTLALERELKEHGFTPTLGWGQNQEGTVLELSFCVTVEPEGLNATRALLIELGNEFDQNAIFEIEGNEVTLLPCRQNFAPVTITKYAQRTPETQEVLQGRLDALRWLMNPTKSDIEASEALAEEFRTSFGN